MAFIDASRCCSFEIKDFIKNICKSAAICAIHIRECTSFCHEDNKYNFFFLNNTLACNLFRHLRCKNKYKDVAETNVRILAKYAVFLFLYI